MQKLSRAALAAALILVAACADGSGPTDPSARALGDPATIRRVDAGAGTLTVYTQNLYVGADVDAVINALGSGDQNAALAALSSAVTTLHRTSFASRAAAIADEIARTRPDVVGFQEGSKIDVDLTPLGVPLTAHEDFLAALRSAFDARGLTNYVLADSSANIEASLLYGMVGLVDYDLMFVNTDRVTVNATFKRHFTHNDGPVGGIDLVRGFVEARITAGGRDYTVVTVHTEGTDLTAYGIDYHQLHAQQMQDVVDEVDKYDAPAVVFGDLNDGEGSLMYDVMTGAGFADAWRSLRPGVSGNTFGHLSDLSDDGPGFGLFTQRIDFVWTRGLGHAARDVNGTITRYGMLPSDQVAGPDGMIWPSDHAGLVATLLLPAATSDAP